MTTLHQIYDFVVVQHPLISYMVFSNIVSAMPSPSGDQPFYTWLFNIMHVAASNLGRVFARKP